jgi:hypothetical protein
LESPSEFSVPTGTALDSWAEQWRGKPRLACAAEYWGLTEQEVKTEFLSAFPIGPKYEGLVDGPVGEGVLDWEIAGPMLLQALREQLGQRSAKPSAAAQVLGWAGPSSAANGALVALAADWPGAVLPSYADFLARLISESDQVLVAHADYTAALLVRLQQRWDAEQFDKFPLFSLTSQAKHRNSKNGGRFLSVLNAGAHGWIVEVHFFFGEDPVLDAAYRRLEQETRSALSRTLAGFGCALSPAAFENVLRGNAAG